MVIKAKGLVSRNSKGYKKLTGSGKSLDLEASSEIANLSRMPGSADAVGNLNQRPLYEVTPDL